MNIPLNIDWQQILLHLFNFVILAGGLYLLLYKPVLDFMNKRTEHYQEMYDQAQEKLENAARMESDRSLKLKDAETEIKRKETEAREELSREIAEMRVQAQAQCDALLEKAKENAERESERILEGTRKEAAGLAVEAVEKLLGMTSEKSVNSYLEESTRKQA